VSTNNKFTLAASKSLTRYMLFGTASFVLLPVPFTVYKGVQYILLYVICDSLAAILGCLYLYSIF
jgi:hypothetical protein